MTKKTATKTDLSATDAAKMLRGALHRRFPGQDFTVRLGGHVERPTIHVGYVDGPPVLAVEQVTSGYARSYGHRVRVHRVMGRRGLAHIAAILNAACPGLAVLHPSGRSLQTATVEDYYVVAMDLRPAGHTGPVDTHTAARALFDRMDLTHLTHRR